MSTRCSKNHFSIFIGDGHYHTNLNINQTLMQLTLANFTKFLRARSKNLPKAWLVFGGESGSVQRSCEILINMMKKGSMANSNLSAVSPNAMGEVCEVIRVDDDGGSGKLYDEIFTLSLFPCTKTIVVSYNDKLHSLCHDILQLNIPSHINIILKGGELKKGTRIRNLFESAENFVALHCYEQGEEYTRCYVAEYLSSKKVAFDEVIISAILRYHSSNIAILQRELEKLILYSNGEPLNEATIDQLMSDEGKMVIDNLLQAIAIGDRRSIVRELMMAERDGVSVIFLIRLVQIYINRIIEIKQLMQSGSSLNDSISQLKIYLFGKAKDCLVNGVKLMSIEHCRNILRNLVESEKLIKSKLIGRNQFASILLSLL